MADSDIFDNWSNDYDNSIDSDRFPFIGFYDVLSHVQQQVTPYKGLKVLDIGIGTGLLSADLYDKGCEIYGVDFSEKMLEKASEKIPNGKFEQIDIIKNHFGRFSDLRFDRIISSYVIHHFNDDQKIEFITKTIAQNLSPNGRIIIADIGFTTKKDFAEGRRKYQAGWDKTEFYLCGETLVSRLEEKGIDFSYRQLTECAGCLYFDSR